MDAEKIEHVNFFAYFWRRALDAESTQFVRKSTQLCATVRHAYTIVRYPTPDHLSIRTQPLRRSLMHDSDWLKINLRVYVRRKKSFSYADGIMFLIK